ncbi:caspase-8-like [Achroia grisella]|uniref:caspase-8-like n=1 Tax=Achroia grisella TaxID=688607 RepID=UPI0027D24A15|nr:caspase-8-like [Achroia grisella]
MLKSDASYVPLVNDVGLNSTGNTPSISIKSIVEIEKELDSQDLTSLVFLLYDVPETALQRLIIYQRVYKDIGAGNSNLLQEWARHAQNRVTWTHEFLEALVTCQIYNVVRKLGFNVSAVKKRYQENGEHYINPMKRELYNLCEYMDSANLDRFKQTLKTYSIDTNNYESCELVLLHLMCQKFIMIQQHHYGQKVVGSEYNVENIARIIDNFPSPFKNFANKLRYIESISKRNVNDLHAHPATSPSVANKDELTVKEDNVQDNFTPEKFNESYDLLEGLQNMTLSSDKMNNDLYYPIKDPNRVGVCYILNQEEFHPSKHSIERKLKFKPLEKRVGSTKDKVALEKTMTKLNFEVIPRDNLDKETMLEDIKNVIKYRVHENHSMFMLCILSHGIKGHVYAADSVEVKIEEIVKLLDCDDVKHIRGMPKVIVIQACQVNNEDKYQNIDLVADAPKHYIKKSDVLIYWATAPDYEAYRIEGFGSLFIQILCSVIQKFANKEHLCDLFLKVNNEMRKTCAKLCCDQLPKIEFTLTKKLYLIKP